MSEVWIAVGSVAAVGLAGVTGVLALATYALVRETKQARADEPRERDRIALQAALVEQVDNCRHWYSHQPSRGATALVPLEQWRPAFGALRAVMGVVNLPGDIGAYLVWSMAQAEAGMTALQNKITAVLAADRAGDYAAATRPEAVHDAWAVELEHLQVIQSLLVDEAARRRFDDLATAFSPRSAWLPWLKPTLWPSETPRTATDQANPFYRFAPPFPLHPAFQQSAAAARDSYARQLGALSQEMLHGQQLTAMVASIGAHA